MLAIDTPLRAPAALDQPGHPGRGSAAPLVRLLATVALASAAAGALATLTLERLAAAMQPPLLAPAPAHATAAPVPVPSQGGLPAVHDVLRDRAEPPGEPPPAS